MVTLTNAIFEGLTRLNAKGETELACAKKLEISPCKRKYCFTLRDCKWSNGKKVTSYDFLRSWKNALGPTSFCSRFFFMIKNAKNFCEGTVSFEEVGIKALSSDKLLVELEYPASHFLELLHNCWYFPTYEKDSSKEPLVFNGPFLIEKFKMDKELILIPNSSYWDRKSVHIDGIQISFIKDLNTAFLMYQEKKLDWIGAPYSPIPLEAYEKVANLHTKIEFSPFWMFINSNHPKFKSANIRKALSYVIDREKVARDIMLDKKALHTVIPYQITHLDISKFETNVDIKLGNKLLEKGLKEVGIQKKDFEFDLKYGCGAEPEYERLALYLKDTWEKTLGIQVNLRKEEVNSFYSSVRSGNYEIGGYYLINSCKDPFYLMELLESSKTNHSNWEDNHYKTYFELAKHTLDPSKRAFYLKKAEHILMDQMPLIPICVNSCIYAKRDNLEGFEPPFFAGSDFKYARFK